MHNLYLGTAKRMMTIWRTATTTRGPMLTDEHLKQMAVEAQDFAMPYGYDSTSLIKKMNIGEQGFSHLKADEWKIQWHGLHDYSITEAHLLLIKSIGYEVVTVND
ncbi:hypothetical protein G6F71_009599 [Rhizopus microsporus]|nr:hypothetical protein G6F71_009599 [Rhizopus microsporus]KAG1205100.1 hypothetical protein G6F69_009516 [Rhizopus microsporus]KAG1241006.1 hypothetical protein G6F68_017108 [Rhizopus microsporus]